MIRVNSIQEYTLDYCTLSKKCNLSSYGDAETKKRVVTGSTGRDTEPYEGCFHYRETGTVK